MNNSEKNTKPSFEYLAKEINKYFKWDKVHTAMMSTEWYWNFGKDSSGKDRDGVPSLETIKNRAYELLKQAYDEEIAQISSGGFSAGWTEGELYLQFTLEETSVS